MKNAIVVLLMVVLVVGLVSAHDISSSMKLMATTGAQEIHHINSDNLSLNKSDEGNREMMRNSTERLREMIEKRVERHNERILEMREKMDDMREHQNKTVSKMRERFLERRGIVMIPGYQNIPGIQNGTIINMRNKFLRQRSFMMIPENENETASEMRDRLQIEKEMRKKHFFPIKTKLKLYSKNISGNVTILQVMLPNGKNMTIKVMPSIAFREALEKLRMKNCNLTLNNCTVELKEVRNKNSTQVAYEVRAMKTFRLFGMFKMRREIMAQISAESGKDIFVKRPWWSWMASEQND